MAAVPVSLAPQTSATASLAMTVGRAVAISISAISASSASLAIGVSKTGEIGILAVTASNSSLSLEVNQTAEIGIRANTASGSSLDIIIGRAAEVGIRSVTASESSLGVAISRQGDIAISSVTGVSASLDILTGRAAGIAMHSRTAATGSLDLTGASDLLGMSICDVVEEILAMWGMFCAKSAPEYAVDRAINDVNAALQLVWNNAEDRDFWTNVPITITLADGENSADLDDDIQNVVGPCRLSTTKRPLSPIGSIGELETFADFYLDGETVSEPIAYHIDRSGQSGVEPAKCVFYVTPTISGASVSFILDVVREAPRFYPSDLLTCPIVPIPHKYVETLLLPIAKYQASSFYLFRQPENKATIDREYQRASISLGLADPLPGNAGDNRNKREDQPQ